MTHVPGRTTLFAALIAAPAIAALIVTIPVEVGRAIAPDSPLFRAPGPESLAEAIVHGFPVEDVYGFIRAGHHPSKPVPVNHPDYTDGAMVEVPPLMLAVAARHANAVGMLLSAGASPHVPGSANAYCLAQELGSAEIMRILARAEKDTPACRGRRRNAPTPLMAWME